MTVRRDLNSGPTSVLSPTSRDDGLENTCPFLTKHNHVTSLASLSQFTRTTPMSLFTNVVEEVFSERGNHPTPKQL